MVAFLVGGVLGTVVGEFGRNAIVSTVWGPRVQLYCEPNNISQLVEMCPDAKTSLFTACLCFNATESNIRNMIIASVMYMPLHALKSLILNHIYPIPCAARTWVFVQGSIAFLVRWSASLGATRLLSLCEGPEVKFRCESNDNSDNWNVAWCQSTVFSQRVCVSAP